MQKIQGGEAAGSGAKRRKRPEGARTPAEANQRKARPHGEAGRGGCGAAPQAWRKPRRRARAAKRRAVNPAEGLHQQTQNLNQNPEKGQNQSIKKEKTIKRLSREKSKKELKSAASGPIFYPKP